MTYNDWSQCRAGIPGRVYFVTTVTERREPVFASFHLGRQVVEEMRRLEAEGALSSLAWVLMPNHLHWLIRMRSGTGLSTAMKAFKDRSALRVNRVRGCDRALWQKAYYDHALPCEEGLKEVARFIVSNPWRARLVERIGDYPLWDCAWL